MVCRELDNEREEIELRAWQANVLQHVLYAIVAFERYVEVLSNMWFKLHDHTCKLSMKDRMRWSNDIKVVVHAVHVLKLCAAQAEVSDVGSVRGADEALVRLVRLNIERKRAVRDHEQIGGNVVASFWQVDDHRPYVEHCRRIVRLCIVQLKE